MTGSLASVHPELIPEWSEKNLPLTPDKISINKMSYAALETPLPLSMQQKGLSPEGFIPGNCVHEVFGGIHKAQLVAARLLAWR